MVSSWGRDENPFFIGQEFDQSPAQRLCWLQHAPRREQQWIHHAQLDHFCIFGCRNHEDVSSVQKHCWLMLGWGLCISISLCLYIYIYLYLSLSLYIYTLYILLFIFLGDYLTIQERGIPLPIRSLDGMRGWDDL